jgi:moderate conductance mechanosensitive channel
VIGLPPILSQAPEQPTVTRHAGDALTAAVDRASSLVDLVSDPLLWYQVGTTVIKVALTIALAIAIVSAVRRVVRRWQRPVKDLPNIDPRRQKIMTGSNLILSIAQYAVWAMAAIMVLDQLGLNIGPLLAGAGIAGLAIGFGAQTLVRDIISGLLLLFDDIIHVGDLVTFSGQAGTVESVSLRVIKVRKFDGELLMVPAGELRTFGNKSVGFARAIVSVGLTYEQDTDSVLEAMQRVADEWAAREDVRQVMLEEKPAVQAIMDLGDSSVTARIAVQVTPGEQFRLERDLRLLLKRRFDEWGIEIPFPRHTVYVRQEAELPARTVELPPAEPVREDPTEGAD